MCSGVFFFFQAEDGIRYLVRSRGLGDVYKRQLKIVDRAACAVVRDQHRRKSMETFENTVNLLTLPAWDASATRTPAFVAVPKHCRARDYSTARHLSLIHI